MPETLTVAKPTPLVEESPKLLINPPWILSSRWSGLGNFQGNSGIGYSSVAVTYQGERVDMVESASSLHWYTIQLQDMRGAWEHVGLGMVKP